MLKLRAFSELFTNPFGSRTVTRSTSDGRFRMGRIKRRYLLKEPIIRTDSDGTVIIEGVSNKKTPIPVKWIEPTACPRVEPGIDGSGDMDIFPEPDLTRPCLMYNGCKALEEASPEVKRVMSLEMARRSDLRKVVEEDVRMQVGVHKYDYKSLEVKIAKLTLKIRNDQKELAILARSGFRDQMRKHVLNFRVDQRRGAIEALRKLDYKKFEWILEKLNLVYKPRPFVFDRIRRRKHTERLTNLWCDEQRHHKLEQLKEQFENEQPNFLRRKAETLKSIMDEEAKHGLKSTVSQTEIDECLKEANEIEAKRADAKAHRIHYHIFEDESKDDKKLLS